MVVQYPKIIIFFSEFPKNKPSSCLGIPIYGNLHIYNISNVNSGLINPGYGCLIGGVPLKYWINYDYWRSTPLINHGLLIQVFEHSLVNITKTMEHHHSYNG